MQCCPKTFCVLKLALTISARLNSHLVIGIIDAGSSGMIVLQCYDNQLNLKEDKQIAFKIKMPNNTLGQERNIFEGIRIELGNILYF